MKRFFYMIAAAAFVFAACEREIEPVAPSSAGNYFPDGKVKVSFTATYPDLRVDTKSMGQTPTIDELYVALFGGEGSFQAWIKAETEGFTEENPYNSYETKVNYVVYLPITDRPRRLHFIANPPKDEDGNVIYPDFDDEDKVINAMVKYKDGTENAKESEAEDAYWQEIELNQIDAKPNTPPINGYYEPSNALKEKLTDICLVRNYAKVHVSVGANQPYELLEYALINVPGSGSVAPWNTGTSRYEPSYRNILSFAEEEKGVFYDYVSARYFGYMPDASDIVRTLPSSFVQVTKSTNSETGVVTYESDGDYMYERTMFNRHSALNSQTGFLARVKWTEDFETKDGEPITAGTDCWYKVEILGPDGDYIPFLRNVLYGIQINGINEKGWGGETGAADALAHDFCGDISTALSLSSLNELSNGTSTIRVNHTEFTSNGQKEIDTNDDGTPDKVPDYVIEWQFFPTAADVYGNPIYEVGEGTYGEGSSATEYDVTVSMYDITTGNSAINGTLEDLVYDKVRHLDGSWWGTITVPISTLGENDKTSVVRVAGKYGSDRRIFREVIINVVSKKDFVGVKKQSTESDLEKATYIEADKYDGLNKEVVVHFSLPEGLGASMFPLNIKIESSTNNLTSTSPDLPVNSGVSAFNGANNSFYFIRQVTLDEYRWVENGAYAYNTDFTATLFTNKMSGNSTQIKLSDEKGFMNPVPLELTASNPSHSFTVNNSTFPGNTTSVTDSDSGVTLNFGTSIRNKNASYLEINDSGTFKVSIASGTITGIIINYSDNAHGVSGRNNYYSSSSPATSYGSVYATGSGTSGTWAGSSNSITFTMRRSPNTGYNTANYIRISSIEVSYRPE